MILDRKYDEVMDKIEVTPEMRQRILSNIQNRDLSEKKPAKVIRFPQWRKFAAVAACMALVLVGALRFSSYLNADPVPTDLVANPMGDVVEAASASELSQAVGFYVADLENLPFKPEQTTYLSYWQNMAEITYSGEGQSATYRKAPGTDNVSGDCNDYANETVIRVDDAAVTLKGDDGYTLATWTDGDYSYSVSLSDGVTEAEWQKILAGGF